MAAVASAARSGIQLLVLPEGTVPAYVLGDEPVDERAVERALAALQAVASDFHLVIVAGVAYPRGGRLFNSAVVIDADGTVAGVADKHFLWGFDRQWFSGGTRIEPIQTSIGKIGALVCADARVPLIAQALVARGAELLAMPTAWVTTGRNPARLENPIADVLARVRARENSTPMICANKCGAELGCVAYCGKSQILDAAGETVVVASEFAPAFIEAEITTGAEQIRTRKWRAVPSRHGTCTQPIHVAITPLTSISSDDERLRILDASALIAPNADGKVIDEVIPAAFVDDEVMMDPAGVGAYRTAGYQLVVWRTSCESPWCEYYARARAIELRVYVVVLSDDRALAIDPQGVPIAGTFLDYHLASFLFEPSMTDTRVAPGTDVLDELVRVRQALE